MKVCVTVCSESQETELYLNTGESILDGMMRQEYKSLSFCGGKGMCGRCRIQYVTPAPLPKPEERRFLTPEELRAGIRLACLARPTAPSRIHPLFITDNSGETGSETKNIIASYDMAWWNQVASHSENHKVKYQASHPDYVVAVDLGTTTIVVQLIECATDHILGEKRIMNPQRTYGMDVISRMEASVNGKREQLQRLTMEALKYAIHEVVYASDSNDDIAYDTESAGKNISDIPVIISGNTVMLHLLIGLDVSSLATYPFQPVSLDEMHVTIGKYQATLLPGISAFVGGDITAGIFAMRMNQRKHVNVLLDLGTNGEIVIGNADGMIATATAAGPAFEGRLSDGIKGSDLISVVAELLERGLVDETGLLKEPYFTQGYEWENGRITQEDIRALQMAKAAIHAGLEMIMEARAVTADDIENVYLAGGFGYFLDVHAASRIGLLPPKLAGKTVAVGNTSLMGAYLYGKTSPTLQFTRAIRTVNLATQSDFEDKYIQAMNFTAD